MDTLDEQGLPVWPAAERNKEPIYAELRQVIRGAGTLVEIAAGTGQHALYFAERAPELTYVPTDYDPEHLRTLERRVEQSGLANLKPPLALNVLDSSWPVERADYVYNANMVHIAPFEVSEGLFRGVGRILSSGGVLMTYGPYRIDGQHTSESNEKFDQSLRSRDPRWGVRDLNELAELAQMQGLVLREKRALPANNFFVVWDKL